MGLASDGNLIDKIFWIFDEDGSGDIDYKELGFGLELLKNNSIEEKLDRFFDLCDEDGSGTISKKEFYTLLRLNVTDYEDRNKLRTYVNELYREYDKEKTGELSKETMKEACYKNVQIKMLIQKNVQILKDIDNWIISDFSKAFITKISFCTGVSVKDKNNAIFYPSINNLITAFEKRESIYKDCDSSIKKFHTILS